MLQVWGRRSSANVQKVMWLIGELKLEHERIDAAGPYGRLDTVREMNPNGLVPVIRDAGLVMWESNSIIRYIAARYGRERFWPEEPRVRAHIDQWIDWLGSTFQPEMIGMFWSYWRTPEKDRNWQLIGGFAKKADNNLRILDAQLANRRYIAGGELTLADIATGVHLYRYFNMREDIARGTGTKMADVPNVEAWYRRLEQLPAYREHVMVSYDELRGRLSF